MKNKTLIFTSIVFIGMFFGLAAKVQATDWYVDNAIAANGNGQSWNTAWKNFSNIQWNSIAHGDTLYISGGTTSKTYTETLNVEKSGEEGSPITIRIGQTAGHNGQVIFDFNSLGNSATVNAIDVRNRSYITIDGGVGNEAKLIVRNLRNTSTKESAVAVYGYSTSNIIVKYLKTENTNNGVRFSGGTGYDINNCYLDGVRGDGGIAILGCTGSWDANLIHDNYIGIAYNSSIGGPDGIQSADGVSIYNNIFKVSKVTYTTSDQHPDDIQSVGGFVKIYNNEFINIGDAAVDLAGDYYNPNFHDVWVYNNVFRILEEIDLYPNYIRVYGTAPFGGNTYGIDSIVNYKIFNNLFIDNPYWAVNFYSYQGVENPTAANDPTASGNEIKNNIFYNCGDGSLYQAAIQIDDSSKFNNGDFSFGGNIYYHSSNSPHIYFRGADHVATDWVRDHETSGKIGAVSFTSYTPNALNNDFHLKASDTIAKDNGLTLTYFSTDKDNISRPQGSAWDIGAYEYSSGTPSCGNGTCGSDETCSTCPVDCGACPVTYGIQDFINFVNGNMSADIYDDNILNSRDLGVMMSNWSN